MDKYEAGFAQGIAALCLQDVPELQSDELVDKVRSVDLKDVDNIIAVAIDLWPMWLIPMREGPFLRA